MMTEQRRKQAMHALEDAIDRSFEQMQKMMSDVIASQDDSKAIIELLSIFNDMTIQQLANRGYIDMQRGDEPSPVTHLIDQSHAD